MQQGWEYIDPGAWAQGRRRLCYTKMGMKKLDRSVVYIGSQGETEDSEGWGTGLKNDRYADTPSLLSSKQAGVQ